MSHNPRFSLAALNGTTTTASYTLDDQLVIYGDNAYRHDNDGYLTEKVTPDGTTTYSYGTMGELLSVTTPLLAPTLHVVALTPKQTYAKITPCHTTQDST